MPAARFRSGCRSRCQSGCQSGRRSGCRSTMPVAMMVAGRWLRRPSERQHGVLRNSSRSGSHVLVRSARERRSRRGRSARLRAPLQKPGPVADRFGYRLPLSGRCRCPRSAASSWRAAAESSGVRSCRLTSICAPTARRSCSRNSTNNAQSRRLRATPLSASADLATSGNCPRTVAAVTRLRVESRTARHCFDASAASRSSRCRLALRHFGDNFLRVRLVRSRHLGDVIPPNGPAQLTTAFAKPVLRFGRRPEAMERLRCREKRET